MQINKQITIILAVLLALSLIMGGCGKVAEKAIEKTIESESGGKVDMNLKEGTTEITTDQGSIKIGATYDWPAAIPSDVPEFKYGTVTGVMESATETGTSYTVTFEEIAADSFEKYRSDLEDNGWTMQYTQQMGTGWSLNAIKDNNSVSAVMGDDYTGIVSFIPEMP